MTDYSKRKKFFENNSEEKPDFTNHHFRDSLYEHLRRKQDGRTPPNKPGVNLTEKSPNPISSHRRTSKSPSHYFAQDHVDRLEMIARGWFTEEELPQYQQFEYYEPHSKIPANLRKALEKQRRKDRRKNMRPYRQTSNDSDSDSDLDLDSDENEDPVEYLKRYLRRNKKPHEEREIIVPPHLRPLIDKYMSRPNNEDFYESYERVKPMKFYDRKGFSFEISKPPNKKFINDQEDHFNIALAALQNRPPSLKEIEKYNSMVEWMETCEERKNRIPKHARALNINKDFYEGFYD